MELTVTEIEHYTDRLFRIKTERPTSYRFTAGEFTMIGLPEDDIRRAYSITSGPYDDYLEFYSIKVPDGPLTSRLQHIKVGDLLDVGDRPTGTLVIANLELGGHLWLMATGTGIAPFISLLRDPATYAEFDKITVCWTVPEVADLKSYDTFLNEEVKLFANDSMCEYTYFPTVTREEFKNKGRITKFIEEGMWDNISPKTDKVLMCGSLPFNTDIKDILLKKDFSEATRKIAGTFAQEKAFVM